MRSRTYQSRNSVPVVPGFKLEDAYVFTGEIPPPAVVQAHTQRWHKVNSHSPDAGVSVTGIMRALDKGAEMPAERPSRVPRVPVWSVACVFAGSVLMAFGWMLNSPVSRLIWEVTR